MLEINDWTANKFNKLTEAQRQELCEEAGILPDYLYQSETNPGFEPAALLDMTFAELFDAQEQGNGRGTSGKLIRFNEALRKL